MNSATLLRRAWVLALAAVPSMASAQADSVTTPSTSPRSGPPIQQITTASALSTERMGTITDLRELPDGRVLVNDGRSRRLLLMDSTLQTVGVVLDSLSDVRNTYGTRPGALLPYRADSTLFVDAVSYAMLVLDPAGKVVRVRSVWRVQDVPWVTRTDGSFGWPGIDARGRIVYRVPVQTPRPLRQISSTEVPEIPPEPDSALLVAVDLDSREADTIASIRIPKSAVKVRRSAEGRLSFDRVINPMPSSDDWAVLSDGTVAVVRSQDYRVEYLNRDGTWSSSPKLPYDWQRMTDEDKQAMVDSIKMAQYRSSMNGYLTSLIRWVNQYKKSYPEGVKAPEGYTVPPALQKGWILPPGASFPENYIYGCAPGETPTIIPAPGADTVTAPQAGVDATPSGISAPRPPQGRPSCIPGPTLRTRGTVPPMPTLRAPSVLDPSDLPDYRPPLAAGGAVRADEDGNLWIHPVERKPIPGGPVYDVVNREGELVNRLQLPQGYVLAGFGKGKVVYLATRDRGGIHLARVRLR
jgi:hypothetical protein